MDRAPASAARRLLARAVEAAAVSLLTTGIAVALGGELFDADDGSGRLADIGRVTGPTLLAIEILVLRRFGGTVAHLAFGMRVRTEDGERPSWRCAIVRAALFAGLPFALLQLAGVEHPLLQAASLAWSFALVISVVADREHRGIHDRLAGTTVVRV